MKNIIFKKCRSFSIIALVLFVFSTYANAASYNATLDLGDGSGSVGNTVSLPLTLTTTGGEAGGVVFTLEYDTAKLSFQGIEEAGSQEAVDPEAQGYCSASPCINPYTTTGGVAQSALFYQYQDDSANGKVLIAAASAQAVTPGVIFNAKFKLLVNEDENYTVTVSQTNLSRNDSAGYTSDTSNLITVVSGIPSLTADGEGNFPVGDTFAATFDNGIIGNSEGVTPTVEYTQSYESGLNLVPFTASGTGITETSEWDAQIVAANSGITVTQIFGWDPENQRFTSTYVNLGSGIVTGDFDLTEGVSYFVDTSGAASIDISGTDYVSVQLLDGLNLLAVPYGRRNEMVNASDLDADIVSKTGLTVKQIFGWNPTNQRFSGAYVNLGSGITTGDFALNHASNGYFVEVEGNGSYNPYGN